MGLSADKVRIVFMGTPAFAVPSLERILAAGHEVPAVFTQPDRPKGRGQQVHGSPVKESALIQGIPVHQPERIRRPEPVRLLTDLNADAMVVVGYGQIIPQSIIDLPHYGILNVHASLLPKYRGAAPVQWAIANGESTTGVTIMRIDAGLDTGDMLAKAETAIGAEENAVDLSVRLAELGAGLLVKTLEGMKSKGLVPEPQDHSKATLAPVLKKEDGRIDWRMPSPLIANRCRGFLPWPGTWTTWRGQILHIFKSKPANPISLGLYGSVQVIDRKLLVTCGDGTTLELEELQLEGRKRINAEAFCNGQRLSQNEILGENTN